MVALATVLGVALGMLVVATILIVDFNTAHGEANNLPLNQSLESYRKTAEKHQETGTLNIEKIVVIKKENFLIHSPATSGLSNLSKQTSEAQIDLSSPPVPPQSAVPYDLLRMEYELPPSDF